jgi:hypothetical protein
MTKKLYFGILYWLVFGLLFLVLKTITTDGGWLIMFLILYPIVYLWPTLVIKKTEKKNTVGFIVFGFILPTLFIYTILVYYMLQSFKPI